jgi:hypothetical protein
MKQRRTKSRYIINKMTGPTERYQKKFRGGNRELLFLNYLIHERRKMCLSISLIRCKKKKKRKGKTFRGY